MTNHLPPSYRRSFFLVLVVFVSFASCKTQHPISAETKVAGGTPATAADPWSKQTVAVVYEQDNKIKPRCSGVIVGAEFVLTAAHCVAALNRQVSVGFTLDVSTSTPQEVNPIDAIYLFTHRYLRNAEYIEGLDSDFKKVVADVAAKKITTGDEWSASAEPKQQQDDVALVHLARPLPVSYGPATVVDSGFSLSEDSARFIFAGYGYRFNNYAQHRELLEKNLPDGGVLNTLKSTVLFTWSRTKYLIFLSAEEGGATTHGDSGGPTFVQMPHGRLVLLSINNWGIWDRAWINPDQSGYAAQDLRYYSDWLACHVKDVRFSDITPTPDCKEITKGTTHLRFDREAGKYIVQ